MAKTVCLATKSLFGLFGFLIRKIAALKESQEQQVQLESVSFIWPNGALEGTFYYAPGNRNYAEILICTGLDTHVDRRSFLSMKPSRLASIMPKASLNSWIWEGSNIEKTFDACFFDFFPFFGGMLAFLKFYFNIEALFIALTEDKNYYLTKV